jgi:hypothetical protein
MREASDNYSDVTETRYPLHGPHVERVRPVREAPGMAEHRTDAERRREVEGWRASGEGVEKYAARRGYSATTLRKWISSVGSEGGVAKATKARAPALVRVVAQSAAEAAEVVIEVGAARIRVPQGFDAALLRSVVLALSESAP